MSSLNIARPLLLISLVLKHYSCYCGEVLPGLPLSINHPLCQQPYPDTSINTPDKWIDRTRSVARPSPKPDFWAVIACYSTTPGMPPAVHPRPVRGSGFLSFRCRVLVLFQAGWSFLVADKSRGLVFFSLSVSLSIASHFCFSLSWTNHP